MITGMWSNVIMAIRYQQVKITMSIGKLKEIHTATHPAARLDRLPPLSED